MSREKCLRNLHEKHLPERQSFARGEGCVIFGLLCGFVLLAVVSYSPRTNRRPLLLLLHPPHISGGGGEGSFHVLLLLTFVSYFPETRARISLVDRIVETSVKASLF
jgi:hypothetical protein